MTYEELDELVAYYSDNKEFYEHLCSGVILARCLESVNKTDGAIGEQKSAAWSWIEWEWIDWRDKQAQEIWHRNQCAYRAEQQLFNNNYGW